MKDIKLKNSILKIKKEKGKEKDKENLTEGKIIFKTEQSKKLKNKINNTNLKKQQNSLKEKENNNKKGESQNENIIDKFIKNLSKKQNSKIKNINLKKEVQFKENKTFIENNKIKIKKEKNNILQKIKRNKNSILSYKTEINSKNKEKKIKETSKKNSNRLTPKKNKILELRNILQTNKEIFSNLVSNIFTQRYNKSNITTKNINKIMQNCYEQIQDKKPIKNRILIKNKINRRKYSYVDKNDISKYSFDCIKLNDNKINNFEKEKKKMGNESRNYNNNIENKNSNNILKTNYMINKRCRIINNKNKKNMSMNLSRYFSIHKKQTKSKKDNLEINISNNNFSNTYDRERDKEKENDIHKNKNVSLTNRNSGIFSNNKKNLLKLINPKRNNSKIMKSHNQLTINNYNTNIKNYRVINTLNSDKAWKKLIKIKHNSNISNKNIRKNSNNITSSCSLLTDENDYNLKVLDQYYTINNTINITNNNSLMGNFVHNFSKNNKKSNQQDKVIILIKKIFTYLDKDNDGFIIFNLNKKIKDIFRQNTINLLLNNEKKIILEKIFNFLFESYKKDNNFDLDDNKIIINEKSFIKYMNYIFKNKLNTNEKNIFLSIENDNNNNNLNKKRITLNKTEQKKFFNKF